MERSQVSHSSPRLPLANRRVLIIVENLPVPFDRRVWLEATALADAGAEVTVISPTGKDASLRYEVLQGVKVYRHPMPEDGNSPGGYLREYVTALCWELYLALKVYFRHGFDVIHACNPPDLIFLVAIPFKLIGKKFLFDHHDVNPELYEAKFGRRGFFWRLLVFFEKVTFWMADVSIATNGSYRDVAVTRGKMRSENVFIVRSGPDLSRIPATLPPWPGKGNFRYLVGYVGVIGQQEGLDLLLEAVSLIVSQYARSDIQFVIIGSGPVLEQMKKLALDLDITKYVTFTGRVTDAELFSALATSDVCVNPDRVNPMNDMSTMNKIIEYMAFGKPIVQFDVKEGRVSAGNSSLYARANDPRDFAEKILWVLNNPAEAQEMGKIGRARVEHDLSWRSQEPKLIAAYKKLFGI